MREDCFIKFVSGIRVHPWFFFSMAKAIDWLKANYDRAVLMAAAFFLFISAVAIWWSAIQFGNRLITPPAVPPKTASQPPVAVELDLAAEQIQKPLQWKASMRSGLFVPEKHFIGADGMPATLENTQVHAPVPNEWFEKYALPIEDADALEQDPDKDGFTNLDEWQGNTDPTKAESHPVTPQNYIWYLPLRNRSATFLRRAQETSSASTAPTKVSRRNS